MKFFLLCLLSIPTKIVFSHEFNLNSKETQTQVLELFTSEGCSSCPPADRWLSSLRVEKGLWKDFIPLEFHVNYWDYIGWRDIFAVPENSDRQTQFFNHGTIPSIYTPGVIKAGKEWRAWRLNAAILPSEIVVGSLQVSLAAHELKAKFISLNQSKKYKLNIALLAMNVFSRVNAGENQGKRLKHDFVVIKHESFVSENSSWEINLDTDFFKSIYPKLAFVAWVEDLQNPTPIQAVGKNLN